MLSAEVRYCAKSIPDEYYDIYVDKFSAFAYDGLIIFL